MGGRPVRLGTLPYSTRRTVYGFIDRQNLPEIYTQFDFANPLSEAGKRYQTIVPQQALFLMNSPMVVEQARKLVESAAFEKLGSDEERIRFLYEAIYQRWPTVTEIGLGKEFIANSPAPEPLQAIAYTNPNQQPAKNAKPKQQRRQQQFFSTVPVSGRRPLESWDKYAHALMQANEALFLN
jgi:hypothetical protein